MSNRNLALKSLLLVFIFVGLLVFTAYPCLGQSPDTRPKPTVSFSATSRMYVEPDSAMINFSVINEAETAPKAMKENAQKMNAVIKSMKNLGVEDKDLKTTNFRISLRYEWIDSNRRKRVLRGYQVQQSLQVKIRNFEKIGAILQDAVDAGANAVGNLQFIVENQEEFVKQVRKEAIEKAKDKAQNIASCLGIRLIRIVGFNENYRNPTPRAFNAMSVEAGASKSSPQIEAGGNKIEVTVTITYEFDQ